MGNKAKRHTHKYHRISIAGTPVWACALPDCNHYMPRHMSTMIPGKASLCWSCGNDMILDLENMKDEKPICINCKSGRNTEDDIPFDVIKQLLGK